MRVYLGSDHAGFELKVHLANHLAEQGYEVVDVGPHAYDPDDDYPAFCLHTGARVVADPGSLGVVIGGSGNGEQIAANKVAGRPRGAGLERRDRPAGPRSTTTPTWSRIGARQHTLDEATAIVEAFLATPFSGNERHARRIDQVAAYEQRRELPALPSLSRRPARLSGRSGAGPRAGPSCGGRSPARPRRSARSASVGRAASRARSAAATLTCDEPEPTRPRSPRSASSTGRRRAAGRGAGSSCTPGRRRRLGPVGWGRRAAARRRRGAAAGAAVAPASTQSAEPYRRSRRRRSASEPASRYCARRRASEDLDARPGARCHRRPRSRGRQRARRQLPDPAGGGQRAEPVPPR